MQMSAPLRKNWVCGAGCAAIVAREWKSAFAPGAVDDGRHRGMPRRRDANIAEAEDAADAAARHPVGAALIEFTALEGRDDHQGQQAIALAHGHPVSGRSAGDWPQLPGKSMDRTTGRRAGPHCVHSGLVNAARG